MKIYIVEGIDGSGKSTASMIIKSIFSNEEVLEFREPCGLFRNFLALTAVGKLEMSNLDEWMCFWLSRFDLWMNNIIPRANDDIIVIIDRSFVSTYAYQISGRMLGDEYNKSFRFWRNRLLDLFKDTDVHIQHVYMRASVKVAQERIRIRAAQKGDLTQFENESMQMRVKSGFDIYYNDAHNLRHFESVVVINADRSIDEVNQELSQKLIES